MSEGAIQDSLVGIQHDAEDQSGNHESGQVREINERTEKYSKWQRLVENQRQSHAQNDTSAHSHQTKDNRDSKDIPKHRIVYRIDVVLKAHIRPPPKKRLASM